MFNYHLKHRLYRVFTLLFAAFVTFASVADEESRQTPSVDIIGTGPLVPRSAAQAIPVTYKNLSHVDVDILKVTDAHNLLRRSYLTGNLSSYSLDNLRNNFESVFADRYQLPQTKLNQSSTARLPIPQNLESGWYLVVIKAPGTFYNIQTRHMLLTDLGIQVRAHKNNSAVFVTRLSDGSSQQGATVELYREGNLLDRIETDEYGFGLISRPVESQDIVVARSKDGSDYALLPMREVPLDLSDYRIGGRSYQDNEAYIYSNRDLVKPGESFPINILLRDYDGNAINDQPVTLVVVNPKSDEVLRERLTPQSSGYFFHSLVTSDDWPTGRYTVKVMLDPTSKKPLGELKFQLEEFVPERMDLIIHNSSPWVMAGNRNRIELEGRYLFGSPAAGNQLKTDLLFNPVRHFNSGSNQSFIVGEPFSLSNRYRSLDTSIMSQEGKLSMAIPTPQAHELKGPVEVIASFNLQESGGAAVQRKLTFTSWIDQNIPGILPAADSFGYDSTAEFDVALLSPDGQQFKNGELEVELMYNRGPYYWVYEEGSGWSRREQTRWISVANQHVTVDEHKASKVNFAVEWGDYQLIVTDSATGQRTVHDFYAGWYQGDYQLSSKPDHLSLNTDKSSYRPDETARVTLSVPIDGQLLVTMESDKIEWATSKKVAKGNVEIEVPVGLGGRRHDKYLTATVTGMQAGIAKRYVGIRHLKLDSSDRKLDVSLTLPGRIEPSTTLSVPVEVTNITASQQDNTWVTVSVVDKGIINLSRFYPVDPHRYLFGQRRYSADIIDLFSRQYDNRPNPFAQSRFGSDDNDRTDNKNDDLVESKTVILMSKPVLLQNGKANIELEIPDYNGEGQFIVTVFNDSQVGQQVQDNTIAAAVVTELSVPRFFVPGDQSTVTLDIFNNSGAEQKFNLQFIAGSDLSIGQSVPANINLADGGHWSQSVAITVAERNKTESTSLNLKVSNQAFDFDRSWQVPIKPVEPWITQASSVQLEPQQNYVVDKSLWDGLKTIAGKEGTVLISHTPVLGVAEQATGLLRYPYGCAEQTTSKSWPFLLQHPELEALKAQAIKNKTDIEDNRAVIAAAVARLATMQKSNGGFSLWNADGREYPWLTSYVAEFLLKADEVYPGVVPQEIIKKVNTRLLSYVRSRIVDNIADDYDEAVASKAYAVYLLSQQGKLNFSDLEKLAVDRYPSTLSRLQMTAGYIKVGALKQAGELLDAAASQRRVSGYFYDYGSPLRDAAKSVLVLNQISQHPKFKQQAWQLQNNLLERIPDMQQQRQWLSTQERGAVLQAAVLSEQENLNRPVKVIVDQQTIEKQGQLSLPMMANLAISNPTDQPLYIKLMANGYLQLDPTISNTDSPFNTIKTVQLTRSFIEPGTFKTLRDFDEIKVGDRIVVLVAVYLNETVKDGLLVERIPAGFVLENPNLSHTTSVDKMLKQYRLTVPDHTEYRNDRFVVADEFHKGTQYRYAYVLRAEVPGTFAVPPVFLESMYRPEKHLIYRQQPERVTIKR